MTTPIELGFRSSPQQRRVWRLQSDGLTSCVCLCALRIEGDLDKQALRKALTETVARHEILRTAFRLPVGLTVPLQVILEPGPVHLPDVDFRDLSLTNQVAGATDLCFCLGCVPFDLEQGEGWRAALVWIGPCEHELLLVLSAACADAGALQPLAADLLAAYNRQRTGGAEEAEPPLQYADVAEWQNGLLEGEDTTERVGIWREHWREHEIEARIALPLPLEEREATPGPFAPREALLPMPRETAAALTPLAEAWGCSLQVLILTAWMTVIQRGTGRDETLVGLLYPGRDTEELQGVIGPLARYLPIAARFSPEAPLQEAVTEIRQAIAEAESWGDYFSWDDVTGNGAGGFPVCFEAVAENWELAVGGLRVFPVQLAGPISVLDSFSLALSCSASGEDLRLTLRYDPRRFRREAANRLAGRLAAILGSIATRPETSLTNHPAMAGDEWSRWLELSVTPPAADRGWQSKTLHAVFEEQVNRAPNRLALVAGDIRLTFRELDMWANRLAHHLRAAGAGPEVLVALCLERSADAIVALLAVWKAGAAYVPLDPTQPAERLAYLLEDTGASLLVTDARLAFGLPATERFPDLRKVHLDEEAAAIALRPAERLAGEAGPRNLAYIIYTSGSTGRPKGVQIEHRSALHLLAALEAAVLAPLIESGLRPDPLLASLNAPMIFDASVQQLVLLLVGHALCIVPENVRADGAALLSFLREHEVDLLDCTPSQLRLLVNEGLLGGPAAPRIVLTAGEAVDEPLWKHLARAERTVCFNLYGPTECSVDATFHRIEPGSTKPTIGRPLAGYEVFLLDRTLQPVPPGAPGEICLGGAGLARGYLHRPDLTSERFVPHPFARRPGRRLYRTGDLGRQQPDGNLEFLGRLDHQVKIRGFRIELGEIEAVLACLPGVREAVVVAHEDRVQTGPGDRRLVAYLVGDAMADALRQALRQQLPDYMIPATFVTLEALPLNPNGKVDRKALPAPNRHGNTEDYLAPRTPVEEILAGIWAEILGLEQVGADNHFFDLGGQSLLATQVMSRLRSAFGIEMPLRELFAAPNLADLAARVEIVRRAGTSLLAPPLVPVPREEPLPLSFAQQRLWFIDQLEPGSPLYNIPVALRVGGPLDNTVLAHCLSEIVRRHEALRTVFATLDGEPVQVIQPAVPFGLPEVDLSELPESSREASALTLAGEEASLPFDLADGPLLRGLLLRLAEDDHVIALTMHHVVSDGWSMGILVREVAALYAAFAEGRPSPLPELPVQYADFSVWQRSWLHGEVLESEISFWRRQLAGLPPLLELPTDHPRPAVQSFRGATRPVQLPGGLTGQLKALGRRDGATLFMVLLAGFQALLARYSGQDDLAVGTPVAGRNQVEIEGLIGFFVNTLVLRGDLTGEPSFRELLGRVRETALAAHTHQDVPFEKLVQELSPERSLAQTPLFQVMLALQNAPVENLKIESLRLRPLAGAGNTAKFDLELGLQEHDGGLVGAVEHATDLFDASTIDRLISHYERLLAAALAAPERRLAELPLLSPSELQQALAEWNDTAVPRARGDLLHDLFEAQAACTPDAPAATFAGETLTYAGLASRADRLAHHLRGLGCGPESRVGVAVERSLDLLVALLGVLKAGAVYIPLDPRYPRERLTYLLESSRLAALVSQESLRDHLPIPAGLPVVMPAALPQAGGVSAPGARGNVGDHCLAYVIYTSGSTGRPKGAMVTHAGMINHLRAKVADLGLACHSRVAQTASPCFDISIWQLLAPLLVGGSVQIADQETVQDPELLLRFVERERITVLEVVPSLLSGVLASLEASGGTIDLSSLQWLIVTGEACAPDLADHWLALAPHTRLLNAYGPTECSDDVTHYEHHARIRLDPSSPFALPIGRPVANTRIYVLDPAGELTVRGVPGELCVAGRGVGRGYFGLPERTAEVFVPDPWSAEPGSRLYRTGDLARWLADGTLEFLGRLDHQTKIRGFRIELGEIEALLSALPGVREAVVVVREDRSEGGPGDRRLAAYVVGDVAADGLRAALRDRLPDYMVPAAFVRLAALPLTPNGKVDRKALPAPAPIHSAEQIEESHSKLEETLAGIWCEVLDVPRVGFEENFFDLGGHSLLLPRVQARLRDRLKRDISLVELLTHTTVRALARHLEPGEVALAVRAAAAPVPDSGAIAIVGLSGRFPGAANVERLWANLCAGISSIARFSDEELAAAGVDPALRRDPRYVPASGALDGIDLFDADFFGYSPREAEILNPQHRLFLECAWEALEDAGYDSRRVPGPVGVFAGLGFNTYLYQVFTGLDRGIVNDLQILIGNEKDFLPTRASYKLDLKGPSMAVQTACSSSLVSVHLACQNLRLGACDMALAGGISIGLPQRTGYLYEEGGIDSPDGCCRAFDADARGTVRGSGVGIVVLKRLADALVQGDTIRAVIRGSAVNNDGSGKAGYTAPSVAGQDEVITMALAAAGVDPATIDYVEAHGTGTVLGDPIEVQALARAFRRGGPRERSCALGSVKSNLGHLDAAAGVTGLIKATLALQHGALPPSLGFSRPNPHIDFAAGPFHVQTELTDWERGSSPRRAGVSSFGIGGTNAHAVLEEAPAVEPSESARPWHLLVLSARTPAALEKKRTELADHLSRHPEIHPADAAHTLQLGRRAFSQRLIAVARDTGDAAAVLRGEAPERLWARTAPETAPPVVFLLPGQGSQRPGMGAGLYRTEPLFRGEIDRCCEILLPDLGFDLRELLLAPAGSEEAARRLAATEVTQPALFVIEHALARLWMEWGVRPQALIGHSLGEYVAACLAGVFPLEDALGLVSARGRLVGSLPPGAMLAVSLPAPDAARRAEEHGLAVAAVNAPGSSVLSGPAGAVEQLAGQLAAEGIEHRPLRTSHAFHSAALEPILDRFRDEVARRELRPPLLPWISNLSGTWIRPEEATDPGYWIRHLRQTVRFAEGVEELSRVPGRIYLEVGPGRSLSSLVRRSLGRSEEGAVVAALPQSGEPEDDLRQSYEALGRLWLTGVEIDWSAVQAAEKRRRIPLPTYPFERRRYWVEARHAPQAGLPEQAAERLDPTAPLSIPLWRQSPVPPLPAAGVEPRPWLLVQDRHGLGEALHERLRAAGVPTIPVRLGETFREMERNGFEIDPGDAGSWARLLATLTARGELPGTVVHLAGVESHGAPIDAEPVRAPVLDGLLDLGRAVELLDRPEPLRIAMVTTHLQAVTGEERIVPEKATLLGACATLPQAYPTLRCRSIDLPPVAGPGSAEALAGLLWTELGSGHDEAVVAYRGGRRWVRHFELLSLPETAAAPSRLREGGVYLITGGAGRVGLALAERLARRVKARLALLDRSFQADCLREIEAAGGEVLPLQADVADLEQVRQAVAAARERWGHIDGVVHAADARFEARLAGTRNLAAALADDPPGFLLLCSSPNGTADASAPIDDAAAQAFLDSYAQAGGLSPRTFTFAVSGDGWLEGTETFERLLSTAVTSAQIVVSARSSAPPPASSADLDREEPSEPAEPRDKGHGLHPRPDLAIYSEPRSGPEAFLASLWGQILGFDRVGAHDNFFELGGDSLMAVRLMSQIEHDFGVKLPISALVEAPTVERLTAMLHRREASARRSPLVRLHPGGRGRPLFLLPPIGGDVFAYVDLAHRLGVDRPVYGLQTVIPTGPAGGNGHPPTMKELSAQHLAAVREVQSEGPWLLAGWSFGAVAAYEMAQQIESSAGTVALLAMIDPFEPPEGHGEESHEVALLRSFALLGEMMGAKARPELIRRMQETVAGLDVDAGFDSVVELAQAEGLLPLDLDRSWIQERLDLVSRNRKAMDGYLPLPYGGRVTLFRAGASMPPGATDLTLGWGALARTEAHLLDADHYSLLRKPALDRLVELLQSRLAEAENGIEPHFPLG